MDATPRQSLLLENATVANPEAPDDSAALNKSAAQPSVSFGRGGISLAYDAPLPNDAPVSLGKVAFRCSFPAEHREIVGEGYVRWRSRAEGKVGIEFVWLAPECRSWVTQQIAAAHPRSFIPSG